MLLAHLRHTCSVNSDVAWVEGDERVVLVDLSAGAASEPMVCPEPAAGLWRAVATQPMTADELVTRAEQLVGDGDAPGLCAAFLNVFTSHGLLRADQ